MSINCSSHNILNTKTAQLRAWKSQIRIVNKSMLEFWSISRSSLSVLEHERKNAVSAFFPHVCVPLRSITRYERMNAAFWCVIPKPTYIFFCQSAVWTSICTSNSRPIHFDIFSALYIGDGGSRRDCATRFLLVIDHHLSFPTKYRPGSHARDGRIANFVS